MKQNKTLIFFLFLISLSFSTVHATEYHAFRVGGSDCTLCHDNARDGSLNDTGIQFEEDGYRYPLNNTQVLFYFLAGVSFIVFILGIYRRYRLWHLRKTALKWGRLKERWKGLLLNVFGHVTILKSPFAGLSHLLLFWSFIILGLMVAVVLLQEYLICPLLDVRLIEFEIYPYFRLVLDICGLIGLVGTILLAYRRYVQKPKALDNQPTDAVSLFLIFFIFLTGFLSTGIRNHLYESEWTLWAPIASGMAWGFKAFVTDASSLEICFKFFWWAHLLLALSLFAYIPFSRLFHMVSSPLSIFFRNLEPKGALPKLDIEALEPYGAGRIEDFNWKHLLELDACSRCGRCQEICPAVLSEKHLNPKTVIQSLKHSMESPDGKTEGCRLVGSVVPEEEIWECTTCLNCVEHCPVFIEPMSKIIEMRRSSVLMESKFPLEYKQIFKNLENFGNPMEKGKITREDWTSKTGIPKIYEMDQNTNPDFFFWAGCIGAGYDIKSKNTTLAAAKILERAGADVATFGKEELCCGDPARRLGNEYLFQKLAEKNIEMFKKYGVKKIVTHCPHCFNIFKREYPELGADFEVLDLFDLIKTYLIEGKLKIKSEVDDSFTYHDPCYLGRYHSIYDEPREIIKSFLGVNLVEMDRIKDESFCCGAGGGNIWRGVSAGRRMEGVRIEAAVKTMAQGIITACPYCDIMFDSAIKQKGMEYSFKLVNLIELVELLTE
jgi:Fe-S oxidoreductase/nitrate reductase gamma subunit